MRTVDPVRHAARRDAILAAAAACFAAKGFHATRTAEICARAGTSTGNLFHYFDSKQAIVLALVERDGAQAREHMALLDAADDPLAALLGLLDSVVELAADPGYAGLALEIAAEAHRDPAIAALVTRNDREWRHGLERLLRRAAAAGQIDRALDPATAATWLAALVDGLFSRVSVDPGFAPGEQGVTLRFIVTRYLRARAG